MKSRVWYTLMIAMFLFSAAAFAELVPVGDGRTSGSKSAAASYGNYYGYETDSGDNGYYTTVTGTFQYYYEAYADAEAWLHLVDGWGGTTAIASASAGPKSAYKSFNFTSSNSGDDDDGPRSTGSSREFPAYTGVYASWDVVAECQIEEGTYSDAYADAYAYAQASMW